MSSSILDLLNKFFDPKEYQPLPIHPKKDDDFGKNAIAEWIVTHPVPVDMASWETKKITNYVNALFNHLPVQQICDSNTPKVKAHLVKISKCCERAQKIVFNKWVEIPLQKALKEDVGVSLALTTSDRT